MYIYVYTYSYYRQEIYILHLQELRGKPLWRQESQQLGLGVWGFSLLEGSGRLGCTAGLENILYFFFYGF